MLHYTFSYLACQTCKERVHCDECETRLTEMLLRLEGVESAVIQMAKKQLEISGSMDGDLLEEELENLGIFL